MQKKINEICGIVKLKILKELNMLGILSEVCLELRDLGFKKKNDSRRTVR